MACAVLLFASVISYVTFVQCPYLLLISSSFGALGRLCFVNCSISWVSSITVLCTVMQASHCPDTDILWTHDKGTVQIRRSS